MRRWACRRSRSRRLCDEARRPDTNAVLRSRAAQARIACAGVRRASSQSLLDHDLRYDDRRSGRSAVSGVVSSLFCSRAMLRCLSFCQHVRREEGCSSTAFGAVSLARHRLRSSHTRHGRTVGTRIQFFFGPPGPSFFPPGPLSFFPPGPNPPPNGGRPAGPPNPPPGPPGGNPKPGRSCATALFACSTA